MKDSSIGKSNSASIILNYIQSANPNAGVDIRLLKWIVIASLKYALSRPVDCVVGVSVDANAIMELYLHLIKDTIGVLFRSTKNAIVYSLLEWDVAKQALLCINTACHAAANANATGNGEYAKSTEQERNREILRVQYVL